MLEDAAQDDDTILLEIELIYRSTDRQAEVEEQTVRSTVLDRGGSVVSRARLDDIAYHALLVELPAREVRAIAERQEHSIASIEPIQHIRPQSMATSIEIEDVDPCQDADEPEELRDPILAILDGVPIAAHPLLQHHLVVDDQFGLEPDTLVEGRIHGTAMASLIVHGDRNNSERPLSRRVHVVPVLGQEDKFPPRRLIVDIIYLAVRAMREGEEATAPGVIIVNLSLGNKRRPFHNAMSAWGRLLDRLAYEYGILFIVSMGNIGDEIGIPAFANYTALQDADADVRFKETLSALGNLVADRRMYSPAEAINGISVGASNDDSVSPADRRLARSNIDPFPSIRAGNPSSALGPGFGRAVKPDILMPGGREHLRLSSVHHHVVVKPAGAMRGAGLKVAAPPRGGIANAEGYSGGTSAATALASRTCHRIHEALEAAYPDFSNLPHIQRAVLLKALLVHPARWPDAMAKQIKETIGGGHHSHVKTNQFRFLGYGHVDAESAVACADDRATFWAVGSLSPDRATTVSIPVPAVMHGKAQLHSMSATLAWFTPVAPGRKTYRTVRLKVIEPKELNALSIRSRSFQPDGNQTNRGTVSTRCWEGEDAPVVGRNGTVELTSQRNPDLGSVVDDMVPFGLAVTIAMPGVTGLYAEVAQRLNIQPRQQV